MLKKDGAIFAPILPYSDPHLGLFTFIVTNSYFWHPILEENPMRAFQWVDALFSGVLSCMVMIQPDCCEPWSSGAPQKSDFTVNNVVKILFVERIRFNMITELPHWWQYEPFIEYYNVNLMSYSSAFQNVCFSPQKETHGLCKRCWIFKISFFFKSMLTVLN